MNNINDPLNEREFELVNIIGAQLVANQRDLSRQMELSLGMTNMLLRRLVTKGIIRIKQLNQKKVEYLLTPKGFSEKMRKSVKYTLKTISSIGAIKKGLIEICKEFEAQGVKKFYILGKADLTDLIVMVFDDYFKGSHELIHIDLIEESKDDGVVLICSEEVFPQVPTGKIINLIEELAKRYGNENSKDKKIISLRKKVSDGKDNST